jgi:hypothetical protein
MPSTRATDSLLLALPLEIRLAITRAALGGWLVYHNLYSIKSRRVPQLREYRTRQGERLVSRLSLFHVCQELRLDAIKLVRECVTLGFARFGGPPANPDYQQTIPAFLIQEIRRVEILVAGNSSGPLFRPQLRHLLALQTVTLDCGTLDLDHLNGPVDSNDVESEDIESEDVGSSTHWNKLPSQEVDNMILERAMGRSIETRMKHSLDVLDLDRALPVKRIYTITVERPQEKLQGPSQGQGMMVEQPQPIESQAASSSAQPENASSVSPSVAVMHETDLINDTAVSTSSGTAGNDMETGAGIQAAEAADENIDGQVQLIRYTWQAGERASLKKIVIGWKR